MQRRGIVRPSPATTILVLAAGSTISTSNVLHKIVSVFSAWSTECFERPDAASLPYI
jgi:hypothetical protein